MEQKNILESKPRVIIAPVGLQPGAILAPLLSKAIFPQPRDQVMLLHTDKSFTAAKKIRTLFPDDRQALISLLPFAEDSLDEALKRLVKEIQEYGQRFSEYNIYLLANGTPAFFIYPLLSQLRFFNQTIQIVYTQQDRGISVNLSDRTSSSFKVDDIGLDKLKELLEISYSKQEQTLTNNKTPARKIENVCKLLESAGQLYAAIDVMPWLAGKDKKEKKQAVLRQYRELIYWSGLREFGLEKRRLFLWNHSEPFSELSRRARQDGVLFEGDAELKDWCANPGKSSSLPEKRLPYGTKEPRGKHNRNGTWTALNPLVVIMGTEPGTTLRSIWSYQPETLFILYDDQQPASKEAVSRLCNSQYIKCKKIIPQPWGLGSGKSGLAHHVDLLAILKTLAEHKLKNKVVHVDLTPGDQLVRSLLCTWALEEPENRQVKVLSRKRSSPKGANPSTSISPEYSPLRIWLNLHAPGKPNIDPADGWTSQKHPHPKLTHICLSVLDWLCKTKGENLQNLAALWRRQSPLSISKTKEELYLPNAQNEIVSFQDLKKIHSRVHLSFLPFNEDDENGTWFEWITAIALANAGVEEVQTSIRYGWDDQDRAIDHHRDELDVVSAHQGQYTLWSCKTNTHFHLDYIIEHLEEARTSADRLLGRWSHAVLVVPRISDKTQQQLREQSNIMTRISDSCCHFEIVQIGHVVDSRFLRDSVAVKELAAKQRNPEG